MILPGAVQKLKPRTRRPKPQAAPGIVDRQAQPSRDRAPETHDPLARSPACLVAADRDGRIIHMAEEGGGTALQFLVHLIKQPMGQKRRRDPPRGVPCTRCSMVPESRMPASMMPESMMPASMMPQSMTPGSREARTSRIIQRSVIVRPRRSMRMSWLTRSKDVLSSMSATIRRPDCTTARAATMAACALRPAPLAGTLSPSVIETLHSEAGGTG